MDIKKTIIGLLESKEQGKIREALDTIIANGLVKGMEEELLDSTIEGSLEAESRLQLAEYLIYQLMDLEYGELKKKVSPYKIAEICKLILEGDSSPVIKGKVFTLFMNEDKATLGKVLSRGPDYSKELLKEICDGDYPFIGLFLLFLGVPPEKRAKFIVDLLHIDHAQKLPYLCLICRVTGDIYDRLPDEAQKALLEYFNKPDLNLSIKDLFSALKLISMLDDSKTDRLVLNILSKYADFSIAILNKVYEYKQGWLADDFPLSGVLNYSLNRIKNTNNMSYLPKETNIRSEMVVKYKLEELFNEIVLTADPYILNILLTKRMNITDPWPGLLDALRSRDDEFIREMTVHYSAYWGKTDEYEPALRNVAFYLPLHENLHGSMESNGSGLFLGFSPGGGNNLKAPPAALPALLHFIEEGTWWEKDFAVRTLDVADIDDGSLSKIAEVLNGFEVREPADVNFLMFCAGKQIFEVIPLLVNHFKGRDDAKLANVLSSFINTMALPFPGDTGEENQNDDIMRSTLQELFYTYGPFLPEWKNIAVYLDEESGLELVDWYLRSELSESPSTEHVKWFLYKSIKSHNIDFGQVADDISKGKYGPFMAEKILEIIREDFISGKFSVICRLVPSLGNLIKTFNLHLFLDKIEGVITEDELVLLIEAIPDFTGLSAHSIRIFEGMMKLGCYPDLFYSLMRRIGFKRSTELVKASFKQALCIHRNNSVFSMVEDFRYLTMFYTDDIAGREIANIIHIIYQCMENDDENFITFIEEKVRQVYPRECEVVKAVFLNSDLYEEMEDEQKNGCDVPGLYLNCLLLARYLRGYAIPEALYGIKPNAVIPPSVLFIFITTWIGNEPMRLKKYLHLYLHKNYGWMFIDFYSFQNLQKHFCIDPDAFLRFIVERDIEMELSEILIEGLTNLEDTEYVRENIGRKFILFSEPDPGEFSLEEPAACNVDFELFSKIAMHLQIEADEGDRCIVSVIEEQTVETAAKIFADYMGEETFAFGMKEV